MKRTWKLPDPGLFLLSLLATFIGLFFIFDAGYARSIDSDRGAIPPEFRTQVIMLVVSLCVFAFMVWFGPDRLQKYSKVIWIGSFISLFLVWVPFIGVSQNGAERWVGYGRLTIQPAEFAKVACVIYLAAVFGNRKAWPKNIRIPTQWALRFDKIWVPKIKRMLPAVWAFIAVGVIEHEPDLGTAAVVAVIVFVMMVVGGVSGRSLLLAIVLSAIGIGFLVAKEPYRLDRITQHANRWSSANVDDIGYQTVQSELGMASGGLLGVRVGYGRAKRIMPAPTTDFIMATVAEETGLVGSLVVLLSVGAVVWRLFVLASRAATRFAYLLICGIATWIAIQATVNALMANGSLPAIGIPMPFISSGGSSLVALWMAVGVCQAALTQKATKEDNRETGDNRWGNRRARLSRA